MFFTYILLCRETGRTYVGQTEDLIVRYRRHREGTTQHSRERLRDPVVAYWEAHSTRAEAMRRERFFKSGVGHALKCRLVEEARPWFSSVG